ncbi:MAG: phenylalanine--tRNA ligase beta subunit [Candidatus Dojkabacteria bacterium]|nr:MAG: phenylalanine--tRNA ligase beta subunit [Candidatus Dojkabacteria bacterium]
MNVNIPFSWLKEFLKTERTAEELAKLLPLHGPQVEKITKNELLNDDVFEIEITPNRIDMASVVGIAREASAITGDKFLFSEPNLNFPNNQKYELSINIENTEKCYRYCAIIIDNVEVTKSPTWLSKRLEALGHNSINLLVDISNYVLIELGYPTHVFDYEKIAGSQIIVRNAKNGEKITTLDGDVKELNENDLVIADREKPIAIAGVKGGINTAVDANTKIVVIEAASFEPYSIRKTARRLDLHTDAASYFEKGLSPISAKVASLRVAELITQNTNSQIASNLIDVTTIDTTLRKINFNPNLNERLLGVNITTQESKEILEKLGFECLINDNKILEVTVPFFRNDIWHDYDLVEEIARIYGYQNIPSKNLDGEIPNVEDDEIIEWENSVRDVLVGCGLTEQFSVSMVGDKALEIMGIEPSEVLEIINPLSVEYKYMRRELISTMVFTFKNNEDYVEKLNLFELNMVYHPKENDLPDEFPMLSIATNGRNPQEIFLEVKGYLEYLLNKFDVNLDDLILKLNDHLPFEKNASADIWINNELIGKIGIVSDIVMKELGLKKYVCILEINFLKLVNILKEITKSFKPISKFPPAIRDYSFIVKENLLWNDLKNEVVNVSKLITNVELIDIYTGKGIEKGYKSVTLRVFFQDPNKTLTDEEVEEITSKIIKRLSDKFSATLRT